MFKDFLKRGVQFIVKGVPQQNVYSNIVSLSPNMLLNNRKALITGGNSGIGKAIAMAYIKAGASVVITGRNKNALYKTIEEIENISKISNKLHGVELDVKDIESLPLKIDYAESVISSKFDILVNNAGILGNTSLNCSEKEFDDVISTNLKGTFFLTQEVSRRMIQNNIQGNILNIASSSSLRPASNPYTLSKWGIRALTLGTAKKLIRYGIVVNGIAPGPTATPMMKKQNDINLSLPNNPSKRFASPEEIANMSVILTSDMGRLVVGDILYMTGGAGVITYDDI